MPYKSKLVIERTKGNRSAKVEHVEHIARNWDGSIRYKEEYYGVTGWDKNRPNVIWLPPGVTELDDAVEMMNDYVEGKE